ncbi:restriction endonuclease subunit S [Salmonella enterica]|nr:restriction endonuclease subunit S [Salmonella enterica]EJR7036586.1 restriction endonuclease subunit S [Salmonella enterica]EJS6672503.1 restriction endonuclease subunit S [Salmonella enterica]ELB6163894.1 restriction endonuclease subunit S [Salmonella enterica]
MDKYSGYSEYKDSESHWAGKIPAHWLSERLGSLLLERGENNQKLLVEKVLSVVKDLGVIPYEDKGNIGNKASDDIGRYKVVRIGDLVINSMNVIIGSVGISKYIGVLSPVYLVLKVRDKEKIYNEYVGWIFQIKEFQQGLKRLGYGILDHRLRIPMDNLKLEKLLVPPFEEQVYISSFLEYETAKIDRLIGKQERLIELLKEKRQAVISHAVTKGLNRHVKLKKIDSLYIDSIPEHWTVMSLRYAISKIEQGSSPLCDNNVPDHGDIGVIKISAVKKGVFNEVESKCLFNRVDFDCRYLIKKGDLLVTRGNTPELVADACYVKEKPIRDVMLSDLVYRLVPNNKSIAQFVCFVLLSDYIRHQIKLDARGSSMTMAKVSQEHIKSWVVALPPICEQEEISAYLYEQLASFDKLFDIAHLLINKLKERRSALISAAVTGKIDVRNWETDAKDAA